MADTSISSQWGLEASLSWFANALHEALLVQAHVKISIASTVGRTPIRIMPLNVLAPLGFLRVGSAREPSDLMSIFCTLVFAISIINVNISPVLAMVEENTGQTDLVSDYSQSSFSLGLTDNLNGGEFTRNLYDNDPMRNVEVDSYVNLGDVFIPTTVWSLDVSSGAHLEHIASEAGTDLGGLLGSHRRYADLSPNFIRGFWTNKNSNRSLSSVRLQVANCGGVSRERSDLDFCNFDDKSTKHDSGSDKEATPDSGNGSINATNNSNDATIASESQSTLSQETQPVVEPGISSPMPAGQVHRGHRRHAVQTAPINDLTAPINDLPAPINDLPAPIDDPAAPVDDPTDPIVYLEPPDSPPSDPVFPIGGPAPPSDPLPILILTPAPPIPETSTEVMMMIGFGIMFLAMRGNSHNSLPRRVARAFYKINKRSLHQSS
jgi:hypothetical protein